jgi:aminoglycoside 3-N-acetyltransferase I
MEIKKLDIQEISEFQDLINIFKDVFDNDRPMPNSIYLRKLLLNQDFMAFVVKVKNKVIGGLTIYVLHSYYAEKPIAYIYDVGITPSHQGQGLGKLLISEVCRYCKANGFEDAYVEAEADDIKAISFYRKTKYSNEMNATHFTYAFDYEK